MEKMVMTRADVKAVLGLSMAHVDKLIKRKIDPVPSIHVGRRIIIPIDSFQKWLARQTENGMNGVVDQ